MTSLTNVIRGSLQSGGAMGWAKGLFRSRASRVRSEWVERLADVAAGLETLNQSTEHEFLFIGERLQEFTRRARGLCDLCSAGSGLLSGDAMSSAMGESECIHAHVSRGELVFRRRTDALADVAQSVSRTKVLLDRFDYIVRELRVLCVCTRIECVRLGERDLGFAVIAEEVRALALEIEGQKMLISDRNEALGELIQHTAWSVLRLELRRRDQAEKILTRSREGLACIQKKNEGSASFVQAVSGRYQSISRRIGEIVMSMQFHDITRQRFEHSIGAIRSLNPADACSCSSPGGVASEAQCDPGEGRETGGREHGIESQAPDPFPADLCRLQALQLGQARDEMLAAVARIRENLQEVGRQTAAMSSEIHQEIGAADDGGGTFFNEVEECFTLLRTTLDSYESVNEEMRTAMNGVGGMLRDMAQFARVIEDIGLKVKLIALNAIVIGAHMGEEGAPLNVLADGIHRLSVRACLHSKAVVDELQNVRVSVGSILVDDPGGNAGDLDALSGLDGKADAILQTLRRVRDEAASIMVRMDEESRNLSASITGTVAGITVDLEVNTVIEEALSVLRQAAEALDLHGAGSDGRDRAQSLAGLQSAYTMEEERRVHASLLGAGRNGDFAEGGGPAESSQIEPELFDCCEEVLFSGSAETQQEAESQPASFEAGRPESLHKAGDRGQTPGPEKTGSEEELGDNVELF